MRGAKILVTGARGFIGRNLIENCPFKDAQITTLSRSDPKGIKANVLDYKFKKGQFTHIIHCAEAGPRATENVLSSGARILYLSSGAASFPGTPYADQKLASEALIKKAGGVIARLFTFIGPHMPFDGRFAAGNFIRDAIKTGVIEIKGDGSAVRSYMHTDDMARWVWTMLDRGAAARTYNVGSDGPIAMWAFAQEIARQMTERTSKPCSFEIGHGKHESLGPQRYIPAILLAKNELGLKVDIPLKKAISKTIDWAQIALCNGV